MIGHRVLLALKSIFAGSRAINVLAVPAVVADTETVTIGSDVYEVDVGNGVTAGRIAVDVSAGGTKAVGTLTSDATAPTDGDTITVGTKVYTAKDTLTPIEGEVLIGASAAEFLDNLKLAINRTLPETNDGVKYKVAAAHTSVTATTNTDTTQVVQAIYTGTGGNSIASTETSSHLSWGATALATGANPTGAQFVTALVLAINANTTQGINAVAGATNECVISTNKSGVYAIACTETLGGSGNAWAAAATYGGSGVAFPKRWTSTRVPKALEVTDGNIYFAFPFAPTWARVMVITTSTGVAKVWDGARTITGHVVKLDNSGSTDWAATDTIVVEAGE